MINSIGSFAAIWLTLWLILSIVFGLLYPLTRRAFNALHPRFGSILLLYYWVAPFLVSLVSAAFLFLPSAETLLVDSHCHQDCQSHVPLIDSVVLSWMGFIMGSLALLGLSVRLLLNVRRSRQLRSQFNFLSQPRGDFQAINSPTPLVFTLGWWNPCIYMSEGMYDACSQTDLSVIMAHERAHQERRDNLRMLLARLCSALLPRRWSSQMLEDLQLMTEQACDFRAAEQFGHVAVAETLLKVKRLLQSQPSPLPYGAMAFAEREVEIRIMALLKQDQRVFLQAWQMVLLGITSLALLLLMVSPLHHASEWVIALLTPVH